MRILTFSAYYTPEFAASLYLSEDIFKAFVNGGNKVDLYVPTPTRGVSAEVKKEYSKRRCETLYGGNMKVHRFSLYGETNNTLMRALRYAFLEIAFFFKGLFKKTDVIFAQSTPPIQGAMAAILKKFKRVKFVYNLQDVFPDSLVNTGMTHKGSLLWKIGRIVENITYKNADKIIVISEGFKQNIMAKGVPEEKIIVIPNWVDENTVYYVDRSENKLYNKYKLDKNKFYICYSGNIGHTQNMDMLLDVAKEFNNNKDICFVIIGDGAYKSTVEDRIKAENIKNVVLLPFQPYEDIASVFSLGNVGLIISKSGVGNNSVPSKTWSIMAAKRPILASFDEDSELCRLIKENNCGKCTPADDSECFKREILEMYNNRQQLSDYGENGREYIVKNLSKEALVNKYVEAIKIYS